MKITYLKLSLLLLITGTINIFASDANVSKQTHESTGGQQSSITERKIRPTPLHSYQSTDTSPSSSKKRKLSVNGKDEERITTSLVPRSASYKRQKIEALRYLCILCQDRFATHDTEHVMHKHLYTISLVCPTPIRCSGCAGKFKNDQEFDAHKKPGMTYTKIYSPVALAAAQRFIIQNIYAEITY